MSHIKPGGRGDLEGLILDMLRRYPGLTRQQMTLRLGRSLRGVETATNRLRKAGKLRQEKDRRPDSASYGSIGYFVVEIEPGSPTSPLAPLGDEV